MATENAPPDAEPVVQLFFVLPAQEESKGPAVKLAL
jgi:hypothetical protein